MADFHGLWDRVTEGQHGTWDEMRQHLAAAHKADRAADAAATIVHSNVTMGARGQGLADVIEENTPGFADVAPAAVKRLETVDTANVWLGKLAAMSPQERAAEVARIKGHASAATQATRSSVGAVVSAEDPQAAADKMLENFGISLDSDYEAHSHFFDVLEGSDTTKPIAASVPAYVNAQGKLVKPGMAKNAEASSASTHQNLEPKLTSGLTEPVDPPSVPDSGLTRLYRGDAEGAGGVSGDSELHLQGRFFTDDRMQAQQYAERASLASGSPERISYVDIHADEADRFRHTDTLSEYLLPDEHLQRARPEGEAPPAGLPPRGIAPVDPTNRPKIYDDFSDAKSQLETIDRKIATEQQFVRQFSDPDTRDMFGEEAAERRLVQARGNLEHWQGQRGPAADAVASARKAIDELRAPTAIRGEVINQAPKAEKEAAKEAPRIIEASARIVSGEEAPKATEEAAAKAAPKAAAEEVGAATAEVINEAPKVAKEARAAEKIVTEAPKAAEKAASTLKPGFGKVVEFAKEHPKGAIGAGIALAAVFAMGHHKKSEGQRASISEQQPQKPDMSGLMENQGNANRVRTRTRSGRGGIAYLG